MSSSSFVSSFLEPGGGIRLLPFVRVVIGILLLLTLAGAFFDVARIHMIILSFLSAGLLFSLSFFESEYNKVNGSGGIRNAPQPPTSTANKANKTD